MGVKWPNSAGSVNERIIGAFHRHETPILHRPFLVCFRRIAPTRRVGTDHLSAARDLAIGAIDGIVRVQFGAMPRGMTYKPGRRGHDGRDVLAM